MVCTMHCCCYSFVTNHLPTASKKYIQMLQRCLLWMPRNRRMFWVSSVFLLCLLHRIASGKVSFTLVCYEHPDGNLEKYCFGVFFQCFGVRDVPSLRFWMRGPQGCQLMIFWGTPAWAELESLQSSGNALQGASEPLQIPGSQTFYSAFRARKDICEVACEVAARCQAVLSTRHKGGWRAKFMPTLWLLHGRAGVWQGWPRETMLKYLPFVESSEELRCVSSQHLFSIGKDRLCRWSC